MLPGCWLSLVPARAAGGAAVRGEGEPGAQRTLSQLASRWWWVGRPESTRRPRQGCGQLGCSYRDLLRTNLELVQPSLPPGAPFWVCPCLAGPRERQPLSWWSQPRGPGRHADTPPGTPLLRGAQEATLNLGLKNEQEFVGQGEGEGKHAGENVGGQARVGRLWGHGWAALSGPRQHRHHETGIPKKPSWHVTGRGGRAFGGRSDRLGLWGDQRDGVPPEPQGIRPVPVGGGRDGELHRVGLGEVPS